MIVRLKTGLKVKIWSDNPNCTLNVYDACINFDPEVNTTIIINYSDVHPEDLKKLAFYKYDEDMKEILQGVSEQCAIETEEWEKESILDRTCPHCKTIWEDHIAALTCPCLEREV